MNITKLFITTVFASLTIISTVEAQNIENIAYPSSQIASPGQTATIYASVSQDATFGLDPHYTLILNGSTQISSGYVFVSGSTNGAGWYPSQGIITNNITSITTNSAGSYVYNLSNVGGSSDFSSYPVTLTVDSGGSPHINSQLPSQNIDLNPPITNSYTLYASGTPPLSYEWQTLATNTGSSWTTYTIHSNSYYNNDTFTVVQSLSWSGTQIRCIVSNASGSSISNIATIVASASNTPAMPSLALALLAILLFAVAAKYLPRKETPSF